MRFNQGLYIKNTTKILFEGLKNVLKDCGYVQIFPRKNPKPYLVPQTNNNRVAAALRCGVFSVCSVVLIPSCQFHFAFISFVANGCVNFSPKEPHPAPDCWCTVPAGIFEEGIRSVQACDRWQRYSSTAAFSRTRVA